MQQSRPMQTVPTNAAAGGALMRPLAHPHLTCPVVFRSLEWQSGHLAVEVEAGMWADL